jgi:hypothetical protein
MPAKGYKKQFCKNGHDTFVCGRYEDGGCKECNKLRQRKDPIKDSRLKQFCIHGHDTFVCGRDKNGVCKECRKEVDRKSHKLRYKPHPSPFKRFCPRGHDKDVVGRTPHGDCILCAKISKKEWSNTEKGKLSRKQWYIKNLTGTDPESLKRRKRYSNLIKMRHWKERGIKNFDGTAFTTENYDDIFKKQKGKCAICGRHQSKLKTALAVDHDHKTGFVRGLLCLSCNILLGKYEKNRKKLGKYLTSHQKEKRRGTK